MTDVKRLNQILAITAVVILFVSFSAFAYSLVPRGNPNALLVNGVAYSWDEIFQDFESHSFTANELDYEGISLEDLILDAGVDNPSEHTYKLMARDPYQQEVTWTDIQGGYLVEDGHTDNDYHRAIFPDKAHSFWVYDLASIEVV